MLPRSEKAYTVLLVIVMSIVVILSLGYGIKQMKGDTEQRPDYQAAPPPAFVKLPPDYIVDLSNADGQPISDEDFELFHKQTRLLSPLVLSKGIAEADAFLYNKKVKNKISSQIDTFYTVIKGQQHSDAKGISITKPAKRVCDLAQSTCQKICQPSASNPDVFICERASSNATVRFVQFQDGQTGTPSVVSINWEWVKTPEGWKIIDADPQLVSAGDDTSIEQNTPSQDNQDPEGSIGDIDKEQSGDTQSSPTDEAPAETNSEDSQTVGPSDSNADDSESYTNVP